MGTAKKKKQKQGRNFSKHSKESRLSSGKDGLRWATNEMVADWRAKRLECDVVADIGCGIGLQAMSLAKKCGRVIAMDIDQSRVDDAKRNAKRLNFRNIEFSCADALSAGALEAAKECQSVFLDPQRDPEEDSRKVESIRPSIPDFLRSYRKITDRIAIEFPPQIRDIPFDCEREYASVGGKLNRLTLYFGGLKQRDVSAVALPGGAILGKDKSSFLRKADSPQKYIYEADTAAHKAGLLAELSQATGAGLLHEKKYAFFTSEKELSSPFFRNSYRVLSALSYDTDRIREALQKAGAGRVLLRTEVDPEQYWEVRKSFEEGLRGSRELVLFEFEGIAVIAEKL